MAKWKKGEEKSGKVQPHHKHCKNLGIIVLQYVCGTFHRWFATRENAPATPVHVYNYPHACAPVYCAIVPHFTSTRWYFSLFRTGPPIPTVARYLAK
ncbi:hypothetical protein POVWA2_016620 [Plasmodium ovale wallikeri]|uniref:Uncharacterized protein n=1 Tax=Plasmodium ovale wallikeri TaxID=864142 RepID=A0A1A9AK83_PLAOA|nr:hypothetical protein POVWA2_016620 [Plasmodium ovale wallikeri]SBT56492.1 hypothetical protein POVWA1_076470 [Plasmodium ovale wallikeri]